MSTRPSGRTQASSKQDDESPRLPHEHDESSDSQDNGGKPRPIIEKAHDDVAAGRVDTDRGTPMNDTYDQQKDVDRTGVDTPDAKATQEPKKETQKSK